MCVKVCYCFLIVICPRRASAATIIAIAATGPNANSGMMNPGRVGGTFESIPKAYTNTLGDVEGTLIVTL